jgi:hypothetical protein
MNDKTEEIVSIVTAYRFIAMLMALLVALMGHYNIVIDQEVSNMINTFLVSFIGINSGGKWIDKIAGAIESKNNYQSNGEV